MYILLQTWEHIKFIMLFVCAIDVAVLLSKPHTVNKRNRGMNYCNFCEEAVIQLPRHLKRIHSDLTEVSEVLCKSGRARTLGLMRLRNLGNFKHNITVLQDCCGTLRVSKRSGEASKIAEDYLPCTHCLAFYCKEQLWRHVSKCLLNPKMCDKHDKQNATKAEEQRGRVGCCVASQLLLDASVMPSGSMDTVLDPSFKAAVVDKMHKDQVRSVAIGDVLICRFGEVLFKRLGPQRALDIQQRMRQLARLLRAVEAPNHGERLTLLGLISGSNFDLIVSGIHKLAGLSIHSTGRRIYSKPSLASKLGHSLLKCAQMKIGMGIRQKDSVMQSDAKDFLSLHTSDWQDSVSVACTTSAKLTKINKVQNLPTTDDLKRLKEYQEHRMQVLVGNLKQCPTYDSWRELSEHALTRVTLFNKRRGGEASQLLVSQYEGRPHWKSNTNADIFNSLTPVEQELVKRMDYIQIPGKRLNTVHILLTPDEGSHGRSA